jgi:cell division protein ZapB
LDNETILRQFEEIEQKVEKLIGVCQALEATKSELMSKVERLEKELQSKMDIEKQYGEEKDLIRSKIDGLLAKLQEISEP